MTTFQSTAQVNKPVNDVYNFLADFNNHRELMPESIEDWTSTFNTANFSIQNMAKLALKIDERIEDKELRIIPAEKPPFDLELKWELSTNGETTDVVFTILAELNMMLKMLASGPLQKLADHETSRLVLLLS